MAKFLCSSILQASHKYGQPLSIMKRHVSALTHLNNISKGPEKLTVPAYVQKECKDQLAYSGLNSKYRLIDYSADDKPRKKDYTDLVNGTLNHEIVL